MCGIAGYIVKHGLDDGVGVLRRMGNAIRHRGPDDSGEWLDSNVGVGFSHRRLSILDLSPEGHQPMSSPSGRFVISYNGEVYNFRILREELSKNGYSFRGHSDTEVILAALEAWGLIAAVKRFVGMFAIAVWDKQERQLHLVRDRLGIKPIYYGWVGESFVFSSELKALKVFPGFSNSIDRNSVALLMRYNYVPAPHSIYENVYKLLPGNILTIKTDDSLREPMMAEYWSVQGAARAGLEDPFSGTAIDAVAELDRILRDAIKLRMIADVPLGAFLSGGYDSTVVVALMQAQSSNAVKTFTIGFNEEGYNEATHAKAVASHLGTDHTELYVTPEEAMSVIPQLPTLYDEPFSDSSQIPTFLVSKLAREFVTVSLSGDGGDELFAGYNRYAWGQSIWNKIGRLPGSVKKGLSHAMTRPSPETWGNIFTKLGPVLPKWAQVSTPGDKMHKLAALMTAGGSDELYRHLVSHWDDPTSLVMNSEELPTALTDSRRQMNFGDFTQKMMFTDQISYLPDDILTKVDRASMGVSLEARVPLLDHRVVEFAWRVPLDLKLRDSQSKWLLRQVLNQYVPQEIMDRPKMGFGVPIDSWLRGPMSDWADGLLDPSRLKNEGFFNVDMVRKKWKEHQSGERNWQYLLWDVLMFQAWQDNACLVTDDIEKSANRVAN